MAPEIVQEVIDWLMGRRKRKSYYGKVVMPKPGSPSRKRRASDEVWLDTSETPAEEDVAEQMAPDFSSKSAVEEDRDAEQLVTDVDEEADYRELPDSAGKTPVQKKEAGPHIVSFMIEGESESTGQKPADNSNVSFTSFTEKDISGSISSDFASRIPVAPIYHETDEEEEMGDSYYIARNDSESIVVRQMHPDCKVMIPSDYPTALDEIKTCPLDCPYRALEVAEIDQKALRNR